MEKPNQVSLFELLLGADVAGMSTFTLATIGGPRVKTGIASGGQKSKIG